jgi:hypothetical protein
MRSTVERILRELDERAQPFRRRAATKVTQPDTRPTPERRQVVVVPNVNVHAAKSPRLGADDVPLHRRDAGVPLLTKDLREGAAEIAIHVERPQRHPVGQLHDGDSRTSIRRDALQVFTP